MTTVNLRSLMALLAAALLLPARAFPLETGETTPAPVPAEMAQKEKETTGRRKGIMGLASYYARHYNGRRTNSGQRYDPEKMTAAHPNLPLGTKVKVTNLANNKEVVVTINDRCRKKAIAFIDLSRKAARLLGFLGKGTARVLITPLEEVGGM